MAEYDPIDIQAQERARQAKALREQAARETEIGDVRWLMSTQRGRRIVWRLLQQSGAFRLSFNTNAMQMAFAEGNRNFGNAVMAQILELCPDRFPVMLAENAPKDEPEA